MEAEHYVSIIMETIRTIGVVLVAIAGGVTAVLAASGRMHAKQANQAVNQNVVGAQRLYDVAKESLEISKKNSERLGKVESRLDEGEGRFEALFELHADAKNKDKEDQTTKET